MREPRRPWKPNQRGVAMILVALSMILIMGMAALAVDVGNMYLEKSTLEKATELAALGAAQSMKSSDDPEFIESVALEIFTGNGLEPNEADITVNVSNGTETAMVRATLKVPFYFAKVLGFESIDLAADALAELLPDGSSRLIQESTYDLVPWGIPHGKAWYDEEDEQLNIDNYYFYDWCPDPGFEFQIGDEYLLKLGEGQPGDAIGRKLLIIMDGTDDMYPTDANDPICPEVGSRVQAEYLKAYGLIYWCLQQGYHVDWLLDYNGGSFLVDFHEEILEAVSDTGVDFSTVSKLTLTASQAARLSSWLATHNNSEGRPYSTVPMDNVFDVAVFTQNEYSAGDLMPWGLQYKADNYPFGYTVGEEYLLKYGSGSAGGYGQGNFGALTLGGEGANVYRDNIINGVSNPDGRTYYVGKTIDTKPGNMNGPTVQGLADRIASNKLYIVIPVVSKIDVNGKKSTTIKGFLNFKLNSVDSTNSWVYGTLVERIPTDELNYEVNEDLSNEIVAKALNLGGIPFDWIHDEDALNGNIDNYDWIYTHHEDFWNPEVAVKIAQWVSGGKYFFNMCWATDRFDNALEVYNHEQFDNDTAQYVPRMFFKSYPDLQIYRCYRCASNNYDDDCCHYSGWIREYVKHTDINNITDNSYSIKPRDIMQTQNHVNTVPKDNYLGRTHAFNKSGLIDDYQVLAKDNVAVDYREGIVAYQTSSIARMVCRSYKINENDPGGFVTFYGGHDPAKMSMNYPAYRLILNNVLAGSQVAAVSRNDRRGFGALDLDATIEDKDASEYLAGIKYGYEKFLYPGKIVHALPDNLAAETNLGVSFNVSGQTGTWDSHDSDSSRVVLVPIVDTVNPDGTTVCNMEQTNIDEEPAGIYSVFQRDCVRIRGIAKFWLLDVLNTDPDELDDSLGPVENGQVRGVFLGYFIPPVE
ncbi:MAG: Tad domain-containing protein [Candidatus Wallbacteria bacterium]|nr:Tad domain-containing protein [Candidatus Wallbacteria bacterium]